jgi:hypothetical protein
MTLSTRHRFTSDTLFETVFKIFQDISTFLTRIDEQTDHFVVRTHPFFGQQTGVFQAFENLFFVDTVHPHPIDENFNESMPLFSFDEFGRFLQQRNLPREPSLEIQF